MTKAFNGYTAGNYWFHFRRLQGVVLGVEYIRKPYMFAGSYAMTLMIYFLVIEIAIQRR